MECSSQKAAYTLPIFKAEVYEYRKTTEFQQLRQEHNYSQGHYLIKE